MLTMATITNMTTITMATVPNIHGNNNNNNHHNKTMLGLLTFGSSVVNLLLDLLLHEDPESVFLLVAYL